MLNHYAAWTVKGEVAYVLINYLSVLRKCDEIDAKGANFCRFCPFFVWELSIVVPFVGIVGI